MDRVREWMGKIERTSLGKYVGLFQHDCKQILNTPSTCLNFNFPSSVFLTYIISKVE